MLLLNDTIFTKGAMSYNNWLKQLYSYSSRQYYLHLHCTALNSQDLKPTQKSQNNKKATTSILRLTAKGF